MHVKTYRVIVVVFVKRFDIYIELILYMFKFIIFHYIFYHILIDKYFLNVYHYYIGLWVWFGLNLKKKKICLTQPNPTQPNQMFKWVGWIEKAP